jgi:hypothetical protein
MTYVVLSFPKIYVTNCWWLENHFQIIDELRILDIAPSLGGCESLVEQPTIISYWWVLSFVEGFCIRLTCLIWTLILLLKDHFRVYMLKMDAICPTIVGFYKKKSIYLQVLFITLVESITKMKKMMSWICRPFVDNRDLVCQGHKVSPKVSHMKHISPKT